MQERRGRIYRCEGIVLARRDWGEADRLVTLFTPDRGKLRVLAPGARKPSSRKSGHLELFSRGRFVLARGRTFDKITQAETLAYLPALREQLELVSAAYLLGELVERFLEEHDENPLLYALLVETLQRLDAGEPPALAMRFFELRMLAFVGYQPQLFDCQHCGSELEPVDQFFDVAEGGALCPACASGEAAPLPLKLATLKILRLMQRTDWATVRGLRLTEGESGDLQRLLHRYLAFLLERDLKAIRFMEQLRGSES